MKKLAICLSLFLSLNLFAQAPYFTANPALSPDAEKIVFSYEGDIWMVSSSGGNATRIIAMDGMENHPKYSPDGKFIAFTSNQNGNNDVYVVSSDGGEIKQLTYHSAGDKVETWSWDSEYIYFSSNRDNRINSYKVSVNGGTPVKLFDGFFIWAHNIALDPNTHGVYFNESWESFLFPSRKRYKGDFNPDIKYYNSDTDEYKELTNYRGKDFFPVTDKSGKLYFLSDEGTDEFNLHTFENSKKKRLTNHTSSMYGLNVAANGKLIVFTMDYQTYTYNPANGKTELVNIRINENDFLDNLKPYNVSGKISQFDISPDKKKIAFTSRGKLFVSDIKGKFVKDIPTNNTERVVEVKWLKDNKTLLYTRTVKGWLNLFTIDAESPEAEKQLTFDEMNNQALSLNSKMDIAVFISGSNGLKLISLDDYDVDMLVKDEFWALAPTKPYFSPDDRYIAYAVIRDFEEDIHLYDTKTEKSIPFTKTGVTESNPYWSPDGKYLCFQSDPQNPSYPSGTKDSEIFRVALQNYGPKFKSNKLAEVFSEKKDTTKDTVVTIDFENLDKRWESIADHPHNQYAPVALSDGDKEIVLYTSNHDSKGWGIWKWVKEPFEKAKNEKVISTGSSWVFDVVIDNEYYYVDGGKLYKLNISSNKADEIKPDFSFEKNVSEEFSQMFYEAWANITENYYDENFHGVDWKSLKKKYEQFLPHIKTRANLRVLFNDMLGELNSSHQGFYSSGKEEDTYFGLTTAETGIIYDNNNPVLVDRIIKNSPADNVDITIEKGDMLKSVNGKRIAKGKNVNEYFLFSKMPEEIVLEFRDAGKVKIKPFGYGSKINNFYDEWEISREELTHKLSDNRIAYIHMRDMGSGQLNHFIREMVSNAHYKDALILDLRYNRGGNVHNQVLQFLSQKSYAKWKYRNGKFAMQPNFNPADKPIVMLINEQSLSDAEMTSAGFKELGLGTIVGTNSYAWLIFTSGKGLVDGSFYRLPSWGCYTLSGKDIEATGVKPDVYIKNRFIDKLNNKDPQLEKAIKIILEQL